MKPPPGRSAKRSRAAAAGAAPGRRAVPARASERAWRLLPLLAGLALLVSLRGGAPGWPVADDYAFLHRLRFQQPLDPFDSMGASYYWRPLSRQLYFTLVGPALPHAPWIPALLHLGLLALTAGLAGAIARRFGGTAAAMAAIAAVLVSEPARVLVAWPSGAQHLLGAACALLALRLALSSRRALAGLAALAGVLSHESAALVLPLLPLVAATRPAPPARADAAPVPAALAPRVMPALVVAVAVGAIWLAGYGIARGHGVVLPAGADTGAALSNAPRVLPLALAAALNLEDLAPPARWAWLAALGLPVLAAIPLAWRRGAAARPALLAAACAWAVWLAGSLPLGALLPDWNAWRAWVPTLALAIGAALVLAAAHPALGAAWVALRLVALLLAPQPGPLVSRYPPAADSHLSFVRLTRLQKLTAAIRREVLAIAPRPAPGTTVRYWMMPQLSEFAFQGSSALQTWLRDSTLRWEGFGGEERIEHANDPLIEFLDHDPDVAQRLPAGAVRQSSLAYLAFLRGDTTSARASWLAALDSLPRPRGWKYGSLLHNLAVMAYARGDRAGADSLHRLAAGAGYDDPAHWALGATLAHERGDVLGARRDLQRALSLDPKNRTALALARRMGLRVSVGPPGAGRAP